MRQGLVYRNGILVGTLTEYDAGYEFAYEDGWYNNPSSPAVSLTMPKTQKIYANEYLFPFFYNMLSEGVNRSLQCRQLKIDENDDFGLLLATASIDTIGAITVIPVRK